MSGKQATQLGEEVVANDNSRSAHNQGLTCRRCRYPGRLGRRRRRFYDRDWRTITLLEMVFVGQTRTPSGFAAVGFVCLFRLVFVAVVAGGG